MHVPFLDLKALHDPLKADILTALGEVIDRSAFAGGPYVAAFEEAFAAYCQTKYAVAVGNGTDALWLALLASGIGPGDEVITVPNSFLATAEAISYCGARPVFVDIAADTYTLDPTRLAAAITPRTKAIIPVHLYGQCADLDPIVALAQRHGLRVIEDACQAHGAEYRGRKAGSIGQAGCFSFYPGKNLGAMGEGGAVTTNDPVLAQNLRVLRDHGQDQKYFHARIGWNARMDGFQGAVLRLKLPHLDRGNAARHRHAQLYRRLLADVPEIGLPVEAPYARHIFHLYVVRVPERDQLLRQLGERGIHCGIHYPRPIHLQQAYAFLGLGPGSFPVTERCAAEILSLPMFPDLTPAQIEAVASALRELVAAATPVPA